MCTNIAALIRTFFGRRNPLFFRLRYVRTGVDGELVLRQKARGDGLAAIVLRDSVKVALQKSRFRDIILRVVPIVVHARSLPSITEQDEVYYK